MLVADFQHPVWLRRATLLGWPDNGPLFFYAETAKRSRKDHGARHLIMSQFDKVAEITQLTEPLAASLGLRVWGVEISGQGAPLARIYVDAVPSSQTDLLPAEEPSLDEDSFQTETQDGLASGVTIDQCAHLSRLLGLALDVEDPFASRWTLEVSSPGLERVFFTLDQLREYVGSEIDVTVRLFLDQWPARKRFTGELAAVLESSFTLAIPAEHRLADQPDTATIPWDMVRKARLVHHFPGQSSKRGVSPKKHPKKSAQPHDSGDDCGGNA